CALQCTESVQRNPRVRASYFAEARVDRRSLCYTSTLSVNVSWIKLLVSDRIPVACCEVFHKVPSQGADIRRLQWPRPISKLLRQQQLTRITRPLVSSVPQLG